MNKVYTASHACSIISPEPPIPQKRVKYQDQCLQWLVLQLIFSGNGQRSFWGLHHYLYGKSSFGLGRPPKLL